MSRKFADIIIDISHEAIDRTFQYIIPEELEGRVHLGVCVSIPFGRGNSVRKGYVIGLSDKAEIDESRLKSIISVNDKDVEVSGSLIELAAFIKETYGSTMINALNTVMPIRQKVKSLVKKEVRLLIKQEEIPSYIERYEKRRAKAKIRLLSELADEVVLPYELVTGKLNVSAATIKAMEKEGVLSVEEEGYYRNVIGNKLLRETLDDYANYAGNPSDLGGLGRKLKRVILNDEQKQVIDTVTTDIDNGDNKTYLLKGITGSGKTLVYIEIIEHVLNQGKQAIVLIPEIALTYQTVKRFRNRFGDKVTIMNSRLSKGERFDQFERAKNGDVSVMIGPRSALFAPFERLGIIVIDEEHETTYKSDQPPKYHAREVAIHRAKMCGASVLLGSATPSVEAYQKALDGEYELMSLTKRARENAELSRVTVVDLRNELKNGNKSMFSSHLKKAIESRLKNGEQTMLFINRRGYAGFVSCRSCGHVFICPHCDVSLTIHDSKTARERLVCHYCGHEQKKPEKCPECGSAFIAGFGVGTQKVEESVLKLFPQARVLRMDADTTKKKDSHEKILSEFSCGEADILIGTQMIVKGHDFPDVTLVGVIAADTTLFESDYRASEKTFDLLTQAAGRAGRGNVPGEVVIQTYKPDHYCINAAAHQDYERFFEDERAYRKTLSYPPYSHMMAVFMESPADDISIKLADFVSDKIRSSFKIRMIGPCEAGIYKLGDKYRRVIYLKDKELSNLTAVKDYMEGQLENAEKYKECYVSFDLDPMRSY